MLNGPRKIELSDIFISSLGSLIAGILGSIVIVIITFFLGEAVNVGQTFENSSKTGQTNGIFPLILSIITLLGTTITVFLTYFIINLTSPERYKKNIVILGQISFFAILTYIFVAPMYIFLGIQDYDNIMIIFLLHVLMVSFGTSIIMEILNNYRYILTGIYGSFVGLFVSIILTSLIFSQFSSGYAKLVSLVILLPLINFTITFFKQVFEYLYFQYYKSTAQDQLGDIFYQIELEENELAKAEEEKNSI